SDIEKRIDESKEVTKIKFPNEFNSFTNVQKTLYFTKIADKDYETVSDLQKALDNMIEPILSIKSSSKAVIQSKYREIIENPVRYAFAQYKDYVYSVESSKVVIIDFSTDKENPVVVENPDNEYLKVGTNNNSRVNRYTYQEDGYLYVYSMTGMIRRFSLEDPSNPQYVKDYTYGGGVVSWMDVNGDYLYVNAEGRLAVVNLETGEYKKTDFGLNTFRSYGDYIYAIKSGKVEVYSIEDRMNPSLVGSKAMTYTADGTEKNRIPSDIEYLNGYVMITNYGKNAQTYDLWLLDVSEPDKIQEKEFIKYSGNDSFRRIGYMEIKNGLLFVGDVDTHIHVFDVTALPYIEEITDFSSPSVNHYILSVSDCDIYAKTGGSVRRYSYNVDNLELNDANITQRPVKVTGKAAGSSKVEVSLGTMTKIAEVARDGSFEAEFDDDFVPNGKYTAKAKLCNGSETEKTAEININLTPRIEVTENYSAGNESISVRNAVDTFEGILITCGIKNGAMNSCSIARENVGESCVITNSLSAYADCDTIKSYLIRKTDSGYVLVWEGKAYGKAIEEVGANDVETKNGISVSTDVEHAKKQVVVNVGSDKAIGSVLAVVLKPGFNDISETSIEYIGTGVVRDSKAAVGFCLNSSHENTDYSVLVSVKGDGKYLYGSDKFKYFGPETLNPIFEQIKNANDGNIESILRDNQDKLSIDLSENSDYAALEEKYKKVVLSAVIGNDYIEKGSTQLKNDFNGTVKEQTACSAVNNAENIDELVDVFENHSVLEIDINKNGYISKLNDEAKGKLYARMCNKDYTRAEDIKNDYISGSALEYVNQTPYDVLKPVIEAVAVDLNLTFDSNYKLLEKNSLYSSYMMKEINTKKDYKTRVELNDAIAAAAKYVYKNYYESGNGAGNGGSSSSGGSSSGGNSGYPAFSKDDGNMQQTNTGKKAFSDLESVQWAKEAINALADYGIISGRNDECFAPLDNITREEFTKLVVLAFGYPVKKNSENRFTDVSSERWSIDYIGAAYENGIINGVSETEFAPTSNITRQDMIVMLYRILKDKGIKDSSSEINFEDSEDVAGYAAEAVGSLYRLGIVKGVDENRFAPKENANRAMAAQLIYNCMNYVQR
ncbi:MAG: S-layer homology domain-containing protein, partial [Clostridia bacterium]|nr:S-layer homology domain-containing protein [Clostridia bacterium]